MALRPRWISTQGLTIGWTPIVVAIQGLWPFDEDDEDDDEPIVFGGGGHIPGGRKAQRPARVRRRVSDADEDQQTLLRENMNRIAMLCAIAVEEYT